MFLDEAIIDVRGGNGGNGCVSWRREKYVPKGGPDGGDGGRGGNVVFRADANTDTLSAFSSRKRFEAENGKPGSGNNKGGRDGEDLILVVPPGTVLGVWDRKKGVVVRRLMDLRMEGESAVVACGGRGGFGNAHFATSVRQRPDFAELGETGEEVTMKLELKLVADVGIIGFPSVGKSTLISVVSNARPKIAAYPFTTLVPNLGVVTVSERSFVLCDVPGLIEGASDGKGLGDAFLRHIERTGVLLHVLDVSRALGEGGTVDVEALASDYRIIRRELERYSPALATKKEMTILNKMDLVPGKDASIMRALKKKGITIMCGISAATRGGTDDLMKKLLPLVLQERGNREREETVVADLAAEELPVLKPREESTRMGAYTVTRQEDGSILVRGKRLEQFTRMTDFRSMGGVDRFRDVLERIGVYREIKRLADGKKTAVSIGDMRVEDYL